MTMMTMTMSMMMMMMMILIMMTHGTETIIQSLAGMGSKHSPESLYYSGNSFWICEQDLTPIDLEWSRGLLVLKTLFFYSFCLNCVFCYFTNTKQVLHMYSY
jgi:hypothetical protein